MLEIGFIIMLLGAGGMDSEGTGWYICAAMVIIGALMMQKGGKGK